MKKLEKDPLVQKLLDRAIKRGDKGRGKNPVGNSELTKSRNLKQVTTVPRFKSIKSPSDNTIYTLALRKILPSPIPNSPVNKFIREETEREKSRTPDGKNFPQTLNQLLHIVDDERDKHDEREEQRSRNHGDRSCSCHRERDQSKQDRQHRSRLRGSENSSERQRRRHKSRSRSNSKEDVAENLILDTERFKATVSSPKGKVITNCDIEKLIDSIKRSFKDGDNDDELFHITCHVDPMLKQKIQKGEFIDLERLLPKSRTQIMMDDNTPEYINSNGTTYLIPQNEKFNKISNIRKWDQAFRVYAATVNPILTDLLRYGNMYT